MSETTNSTPSGKNLYLTHIRVNDATPRQEGNLAGTLEIFVDNQNESQSGDLNEC